MRENDKYKDYLAENDQKINPSIEKCVGEFIEIQAIHFGSLK